MLDGDEGADEHGSQEQSDGCFLERFIAEDSTDDPEDGGDHEDMAGLGDQCSSGPAEDEESAAAEECERGNGHGLDDAVPQNIS